MSTGFHEPKITGNFIERQDEVSNQIEVDWVVSRKWSNRVREYRQF